MPHEQPEKELHPSNRHRRSRSRSMTSPQEAIDLTKSTSPSAELEMARSRKHDRHEQDSQADGMSKRVKLDGSSEPLMRKDTSTIPKMKQRRPKKKINHRKVSRTSHYHELQESNKTLERKLSSTKKELQDTKQKLKDKEKELKWTLFELKRALDAYGQEADDVRKQHLVIKTGREEVQSLEARVNDPVNGIQAFQEYRQRAHAELKAKDEIIASQQRELDRTKQEREQAVQENEAARTLNDSNGARNEQILKRELTAKKKLEELRKEHRKTVSGLQQDKVELHRQHRDLNSHLETRESELGGMIADLQLHLQDCGPQSQRYNFKLSDDKVKQEFLNLESKIQHFVDKHTRPIFNVTDQQLQIVWPSWSPELRKFLTTPLLCHLVFEGYIWECLLSRIFIPWSKVWAGDLGESLEEALRIAGVEAENAGFKSEPYVDYQYWRSNSSSFINNNLNGGDFRPKHFDSDVATMVSNLEKLCGLTEVSDTMKEEAMDIFKDAQGFEIQLRMLKAVYTFHMGKLVPSGETFKYGVFFDNEGMVDRSPEPSDKKHGRVPAVDFITSPGLHKRGNNDGNSYQEDTWVIKMGVVCDAARFLLKSNRSIAAQQIPVQTPEALQSVGVKQEAEGQHIPLQCQTDTTENNVRLGTPISDSLHIKVEETYSQQYIHPLSIPGLASGSPAPEAHDAAQMQPGTATSTRTRSLDPPKTDTNADNDNSNTKSENDHHHPMGEATGQGDGSSGKRRRRSK